MFSYDDQMGMAFCCHILAHKNNDNSVNFEMCHAAPTSVLIITKNDGTIISTCGATAGLKLS